MADPASRRRRLAGRLLVVAGVALFSCWAYYFLDLVRPVDVGDFSPLPVALAAILLGVKIARLDGRVLALIGVSHKRHLAIALAVGVVVEFALWALLFFEVRDPDMAERFPQLERLQEPGVRIGLAIYKHSYSHLGRIGSLWVAEPCAFLVLIAIWGAPAFLLLRVVWFLRSSKTEPYF